MNNHEISSIKERPTTLSWTTSPKQKTVSFTVILKPGLSMLELRTRVKEIRNEMKQ